MVDPLVDRIAGYDNLQDLFKDTELNTKEVHRRGTVKDQLGGVV